MMTFTLRDSRLGWYQASRFELETWTHDTSCAHDSHGFLFSTLAMKREWEAHSCQAGSQLNPTFRGIPVTLLHWGFSFFCIMMLLNGFSPLNGTTYSSCVKPARWTELQPTTAVFHLTPVYPPNHIICLFFWEETVCSPLKHPIFLSVFLRPTQEISINQTTCCNL